jgi:hypothetical protein
VLVRLVLLLGTVQLLADMVLVDHPVAGFHGFGGFLVWGWAWFTVVIALVLGPDLAVPVLLVSVALVFGSRLGRLAPGDQGIPEPRFGPWLQAGLVAGAALWLLGALLWRGRRLRARRVAERRPPGDGGP